MMKQIFGATVPGTPRRSHDFYETPAAATEALVSEYGRFFSWRVWEPACGKGKLAEVLKAYGFKVLATDLVDRGYGRGNLDFLVANPPSVVAQTIITNPPFALANRFICKGLSFQPRFFALLLKQTFWNSARRSALWDEFPPTDFRPLAWRLDFTDGGKPVMDCAWCIWGADVPSTGGRPMRKPKVLLSEMLS